MVAKFEQYIRWDFLGLSTDTKPTPTTSENVTNGSTYYEVDTSKLYVWCQDNWYEKEDTGGGGGGSTPTIKSLTEADVNYPVANPTSVSLSRLPDGIYKKGDNTLVSACDTYIIEGELAKGDYAIVCHESETACDVYIYHVNDTYPNIRVYTENNVRKSTYNSPNGIKDNLISSSTTAALSANQGRLLNNKITAVKCELSVNNQTGVISTVKTAAQIKALMDAGIALVPLCYVGDNTYMQGGIVHASFSATEDSVLLLYVYDGGSRQFIIINMTAATQSDVFSGSVNG